MNTQLQVMALILAVIVTAFVVRRFTQRETDEILQRRGDQMRTRHWRNQLESKYFLAKLLIVFLSVCIIMQSGAQ